MLEKCRPIEQPEKCAPDGTHEGLSVSNEHERVRSMATSVSGHETVLLVDDDTSVLNMLKRALEKRGYRVLAASSPAEALGLAENYVETISLLLTDVVMPGMNGRDLSDRILLAYPKIKLIFMSGYTSDIISHDRLLAEGITLLQKPFSMNALAVKIRETLDRQCK